MKRDDLIAGLAARRVGAPGGAQGFQQCFEVIRRPRRVGSLGEVLQRLRNAIDARNGAAVLRIPRDDRRDHQMLERCEARLDLHPLASVSLDQLLDTPAAGSAHRLSEVGK